MTALLRVAAAGPLVSVQDAGRPGLMRFGVPASGPMDRRAFAIAQAALGAAPGAAPDGAAIEVSLGGLALDCLEGAVTLALAGGGFVVQHDGPHGTRRGGSWQVLTLRAGERLAIRRGPWGSWCYLAPAGVLAAGAWLGSRATYAPAGFGGGRLAPGDLLRIAGAEVRPAREGRVPCPVWARPRHRLACVPGPQQRFFDPQALADLTAAVWRLTDAGDRMGVRLAGPKLPPQGALAIPSEPILRGAIQISGDGVATVLMADHQTTGGYPKIATLLDAETDAFAQLRPHQPLRLVAVGADRAVALARRRAAELAAFAARLAAR